MTLSAALPMAPCRPRLTRSLGVYELAGWSVTLIGITASDDLPGDPVLALPGRMKLGPSRRGQAARPSARRGSPT